LATKPIGQAKKRGDTNDLFEEKLQEEESTTRPQFLQGHKTTHSKDHK
tara:strand:+ start:55 stop:198 length:144 start_codon:yes stop_codon:yes gene_type:complete